MKINPDDKKQQKHMTQIHRRNSMMNQPISKFAAEQFDEKAVILCQFCGGATCKQEDFRTNKIQPNAIQGLHSNWINNQILAMQRPSQRLIKEYNIYESFKKYKINTILNLQQPGQHPYCGDGLQAMVGFSYNPEGFYAQGIRFFNESWEDMTATTFQHMMRIMNIFYMSIVRDHGKISVHCHAGRGRTLLVICSWLIYYDRMPPKQTIDLAVLKREGVLTRSSQRQFLYEFQQQLKFRWVSFGHIHYSKSFSQFVEKQMVSLLKHEQKASKFKPYAHTCILNQLRQRVQKDLESGRQILMGFLNCNSEYFKQKWDQKQEAQLKQLKLKIDNHTLFTKQQNIVKKTESRLLTELLYDFYDGLPFVLITIHALQAMVKHAKKMQKKLQALAQPQFVNETGVQAIAVLLDLVHFIKMLVKQNLNLVKEDSEDSKICDCIFIRLSILLSSKRKYCPKIFPPKYKFRQSRLINYEAQKRQKYTSKDQIQLANYLRSITRQMSQDINDLDDIITKVRKVDSNLHYFTKSHNSQEGFIKRQDAHKIFQNSKV